jgi:hypothetical protein
MLPVDYMLENFLTTNLLLREDKRPWIKPQQNFNCSIKFFFGRAPETKRLPCVTIFQKRHLIT